MQFYALNPTVQQGIEKKVIASADKIFNQTENRSWIKSFKKD